MNDLYFSCDAELNGPVYGVNSILSFGCAVYDIDKNLVGTFERNFDEIENGQQDSDTMDFWKRNQQAYDVTRINTVPPEIGMKDFYDFIERFDKKKVFMGYPAAYDFGWINYYLLRYVGKSPFGHSNCVDLKSVAFSLLKKKSFNHVTKRNFPKRWFDDLPHTHVAIDDAIEQGAMGVNILREMYGLEKIS